jgi:uncharacterized protein YodC (DUF2158 family)
MAEQWKEGDVVQLKSGGPIMTVETVANIQGKTTVFCLWFDKTQRISGTFPPGTLERFSEPE